MNFKEVLSALFFTASALSLTAQVIPVRMGRASNVYSSILAEQNQVYANDSTNTVVFIHRQDVTIWGGGNQENGKLRYDLSTDGGLTFTGDTGPLNSQYDFPARYPQITAINPTNSTNPLDQKLVWLAPITVGGNWDGYASGVSDVTTSTPTSTENYLFRSSSTSSAISGLVEGLPGEVWAVDLSLIGTSIGDSLYILKGIYNAGSEDVSWQRHKTITPNHYRGYDGNQRTTGTNISFSPDGSDGWVGLLGDLNGGLDTVLNPILIHSSDGGNTWGNTIEVNLNNVQYLSGSAFSSIADELRALWVDSTGAPLSTGKPTCTFEFDLTVDANGNPHFFVVVGSATSTSSNTASYSVQPTIAKLAIDIFSEDGGATWKAIKVAPIYAIRGSFGTTAGGSGLITMDNHVQISRTTDGSRIFYSWVDSDTSVTGFGQAANEAPNLRIASYRISDQFITCPIWITDRDSVWDGRVLFPTMAPEVLVDSSGTRYHLPIVAAVMLASDILQPTEFWYFGNDAVINEADYGAHVTNVDSDACRILGATAIKDDLVAGRLKIYPNPTNNRITIELDRLPSGPTEVQLFSMTGQVVKIFSLKEKITTVELAGLNAGFYTGVMTTKDGTSTFKIVVK